MCFFSFFFLITLYHKQIICLCYSCYNDPVLKISFILIFYSNSIWTTFINTETKRPWNYFAGSSRLNLGNGFRRKEKATISFFSPCQTNSRSCKKRKIYKLFLVANQSCFKGQKLSFAHVNGVCEGYNFVENRIRV